MMKRILVALMIVSLCLPVTAMAEDDGSNLPFKPVASSPVPQVRAVVKKEKPKKSKVQPRQPETKTPKLKQSAKPVADIDDIFNMSLPGESGKEKTAAPANISHKKKKSKKRKTAAVAPLDINFGKNRKHAKPPVTLPAMGKLPSPSKQFRPMVIKSIDGANHVVEISQTMPNRIATPFTKVNIVDVSGAQIQTVKGDVYVVPAGPDPFTVYMTDTCASATVSLTLIPKPVLGQSIIISLEGIQPTTAQKKDPTENKYKSDKYSDKIVGLYRQVVRGHTPSGYTVHKLQKHTAVIGPVEIVPSKVFSGRDWNIYIYKAHNTGKEDFELVESDFYDDGVRAVAMYPEILLKPNQDTSIYILASVPASDTEEK